MKNCILFLAVAVTLTCGILLWQKNREVTEIRSRLMTADEARARAAQPAAPNRWSDNLARNLQQKTTGAPVRSIGVEPANRAGFTNRSLSQLFRDAMMKKTLQAEAKVGSAKNIEELFKAGLSARLKLDEGQTAALRQLLTLRSSILWDQMLVPMAAGEVDPASMTATGQAIKQQINQNAAQIRALLGDDGYNTWQWFEKTQPQRDEAAQFNTGAANSGLALTSTQQSQLLDAMTAARAGFNFQYDIGNPDTMDFEHWSDNFSPEKLAAYQQDMEQLNNAILENAKLLLTPEQSAQLGQFLAQHLFESLIVVKTTQAMMAENMQ